MTISEKVLNKLKDINHECIIITDESELGFQICKGDPRTINYKKENDLYSLINIEYLSEDEDESEQKKIFSAIIDGESIKCIQIIENLHSLNISGN